ncbi:hypothetical protein LPB140_08835 [Sphingorhabdus lutea]|uniref:Outer membrane protein beta-barrel domain-containing protein n=1 Tax=Sphingorhabdus lutea TaxID=1913578 RepID=A0A1L3JCM1_9SPHN|nr:porin family protein [Sphingorhabdus lutea]APG62876.1 hypothetical protein LPB140_08835 [Sphingorhabdus lutea]
MAKNLKSAAAMAILMGSVSPMVAHAQYAGNAKLCKRGNDMVLSGIEDRTKYSHNLIDLKSKVLAAENDQRIAEENVKIYSAEFARLTAEKPELASPEEAKTWAKDINDASVKWKKNEENQRKAREDYNKYSSKKIEEEAKLSKADITIMQGRLLKEEACYGYRAPQIAMQPVSPQPVVQERRVSILTPNPVQQNRAPIASLNNEVVKQEAEVLTQNNSLQSEQVAVEPEMVMVKEEIKEAVPVEAKLAEANVELMTIEQPLQEAQQQQEAVPATPVKMAEARPVMEVAPASTPALAPAPAPAPAPQTEYRQVEYRAANAKYETMPAGRDIREVRDSSEEKGMDGLRIEGRIGYERPKLTANATAPTAVFTTDEDITYGGEIGYDFDIIGGLTFGPFGRYEVSSAPDSGNPSLIDQKGTFGAGARLGVAVIDGFALFGKLGYSDIDFSSSKKRVSADINNSALRFGGGAEISLFGGFYIAGEYSQSDFGDIGGADYKRQQANFSLGFRF